MPIIHNLPFNTTQTDDLYLKRDGDSGPNRDLAYNLGSSGLRWDNIYAVSFIGTATTASYADVAERFACDYYASVGDVVILGGEKEIMQCSTPYDINVLGIVSESPALGMNSEAGTNETHPFIALSGRVPCRTFGIGKKGQRIVSIGIPGVAEIVADNELATISPYCIIGRLLEDKPDVEIKLTMILVGAK